ncbi:amino acid permease 6-like [Carica papaya]|uniref:amino acid permease 6-like n=1 Tax=Carica papaya TaxID=3649 RepID=UPI000B8C6F04|nr:amino acid permease 6-like [Carica papaya]
MASSDLENKMSFSIQHTDSSCSNIYDDDGRLKRTGTLMSGTAHVITAVIGSGVLSLAWAMAQLGWIGGPFSLFIFSLVTWFTAGLLADAYRYPDPVTGNRNHTYVQAVQNHFREVSSPVMWDLLNTQISIESTIGYTITSSNSMS